MAKSKTFYLIIFLVVAIIVLLIIRALGSEQPQNSQGDIFQFSPPPNLRIVSNSTSNEPIEVVEGIKVKFDKPVNETSLILTVIPQTEITTSLDETKTELTIEPANAWNFDTSYIITIFRATLSEDNQLLDKDYQFSFKTKEYFGI